MTKFTTQTYNLLSQNLLFSVAMPAVREQWEDWSGTEIPPPQLRQRLRELAQWATETGNPTMDDALEEDVRNGPSEIEIDHVIIGAGYAAVINAATLPHRPEPAQGDFPPIIMIGEMEPWSQYASKWMGQSPTNLSPSAFPILPLHFTEVRRPEKPHDCLDQGNFPHCYLKSDYFADAVALSRYDLGLPALRGKVDSIQETDGFYQIIVEMLDEDNNAHWSATIKTKNLDIASGPGPPRKLPPAQFKDMVRQSLRSRVNNRRGHLFGSEALLEDEELVDGGKRMLIYGGSPTAAWVYERVFELVNITSNLQSGPQWPEVYWVARLKDEEGLSEDEKLKKAFQNVDIGFRNKLILAHSKERRYVAEVTDVQKSGNQAKVTFDRSLGNAGATIIFDQVIESIGQDATREGGVIEILPQPLQGKFHIIQDAHGSRPLGLELTENDKRLRILGAASFAASFAMLPGSKVETEAAIAAIADAGPDLLSDEDYQNKLSAFLITLPEEARVPPGITVHGITIARANDKDYGLSTDHNINVNTANVAELENHPHDLFTQQQAQSIIACRSRTTSIPTLPNAQSSPGKWMPGIPGLEDLKDCPNISDDDYQSVKDDIRV